MDANNIIMNVIPTKIFNILHFTYWELLYVSQVRPSCPYKMEYIGTLDNNRPYLETFH